MSTTRPSSRRNKKPWIIGATAFGVVAASSGVAMANIGSWDEDSHGKRAHRAMESSAELCLRLDQAALAKIRGAEEKAQSDTTVVRLSRDVVIKCHDSTTPAPTGPDEEIMPGPMDQDQQNPTAPADSADQAEPTTPAGSDSVPSVTSTAS